MNFWSRYKLWTIVTTCHVILSLLLKSVTVVNCSTTFLSHETVTKTRDEIWYAPDQPQQIHLSLGRNALEAVITFTTYQPTNESLVRYGLPEPNNPNNLWFVARGNWNLFVDGGDKHRKHYIHRVLIADLLPFTNYEYECGTGNSTWSRRFRFRSLSDDPFWSPRMLVYGDLGLTNGQSIPRLIREVATRQYDAILHVGDFGYDLDSDNSYVGDEFMRRMEPIAGNIFYQTCPGNHEHQYNFSNYVNRFTMFDMTFPWDPLPTENFSKANQLLLESNNNFNNHFYSFHLGPALVISFSTEFYYYLQYGVAQIYHQYQWLERTLKEANRPENRLLRPWIITMGHRPMYCSNRDFDDCTRSENIIRKGLPIFHTMGLEDLFYKYGVDLEFWAHEHSYERMWPLYDRKVYNGSAKEPYRNPQAPVHIVTGSAGCKEELDKFDRDLNPWSALRLSEYGYSRLHIKNHTHLFFEQVSDDQNGTVVDSFVLIQEKHLVRKLPEN